MNTDILKKTIEAMTTPGKGLLAADESTPTIAKRLAQIGVESTEKTRSVWRELLFTTPGIEMGVSGVILYDETIHQQAENGVSFVQIIKNLGIVPGIKVDLGTENYNESIEKVTKGLDGLSERLAAYAQDGAGFAKWRAIFSIDANTPSQGLIQENAKRLATYAQMCLEKSIVPIIEPEVLMEGTHTIGTCADITLRVLTTVYEQLSAAGVPYEYTLLKPNMITSGTQVGVDEPDIIATQTLHVLKHIVPLSVPGIFFLSGGQTPEVATQNLNAINKYGKQPWVLSFSYGRALQAEALHVWGGKAENKLQAQHVFAKRVYSLHDACFGMYTAE